MHDRFDESAPLPLPVKAVLALFALVVLLFAKDEPGSWADGSRLGTIQALAEQGTLELDATKYFWQGDKVRFGEHFYSHQPPMLALLGAVPYAVLRYAGGREIDSPHTYRVLTWVLVGLPLGLGFAALARLMLRLRCGSNWTAALLALAAFGTLCLPYALVLNQHGTAAGLVMIALGCIVARRPATAGVLLCLATTIDLTAVFAAVALAWPVWSESGWRGVGRYVVGALPPLALHLGVNYAIAGDFLPFGMHAEAFEYSLSPFLIMSLTGGNGAELAGTQSAYVWGALLGRSGLFSHHPVLVLALVAALWLGVRHLRGLRNGESAADGIRGTALPAGTLPAVALLSLGIATYYLVESRNFGGSAFGMRWFTVFSPLLALFPAAWIGSRPTGWKASFGLVLATGVLGAWSLAAASLGAVQPWMKFAYFWDQKPDAVLLGPNAEVPPWNEHLNQEWHRIRNWRQGFGENEFILWYADIIRRLGRVHVQRWPGFDAAEQEQWTREGLRKLNKVVDEMRRAGNKSIARAAGHYWLGRLETELGQTVQALREYRLALEFNPHLEAARKALADLSAE